MRDEEIRKFQEIGDDALKLMLKLGDPGPNEKYEGKEVDFEQFMTLMEKAGIYKPDSDGHSTIRSDDGALHSEIDDPRFKSSIVVSGDQGAYQGNW